MGSKFVDSIEFVVEYFGIPNPGQIKMDMTYLTGGSNNNFNTNYTIFRNYSTLPLYDPIPYDFLRIA